MERFDRLEGLRAPLAWWVFLAHTMQWSELSRAEFPSFLKPMYLGIVPVFGFMVLSGFVITHLLTHKKENYLPYITRRYFRLAPLIILSVLIAYLTQDLVKQGVFWPNGKVEERIALQVSLFHGAMPDSFLPRASRMFSGPGWSVSLEWQFYLIAPALFFCLRRGGSWLLVPAGLIALSFLVGSAEDSRQIIFAGTELKYSKPSMILSA
ncbi:MAG: acyltransferase, partial [Henriciella sp.]